MNYLFKNEKRGIMLPITPVLRATNLTYKKKSNQSLIYDHNKKSFKSIFSGILNLDDERKYKLDKHSNFLRNHLGVCNESRYK